MFFSKIGKLKLKWKLGENQSENENQVQYWNLFKMLILIFVFILFVFLCFIWLNNLLLIIELVVFYKQLNECVVEYFEYRYYDFFCWDKCDY